MHAYQEVQVHRTCVLTGSPQEQTYIRKSAQAHACAHTQDDMHTCPLRYSHPCWEGSGIQVRMIQVRMIQFLHHFGLAQRFDILRLCFLAPDFLPLSGSATTIADNVPSPLCFLAGWAYGGLENRDPACTIATGQKLDFFFLGPRAQLGQ